MSKYFVYVQLYNTTTLGKAVAHAVHEKYNMALVEGPNAEDEIKEFVESEINKKLEKKHKIKPMKILAFRSKNSFFIDCVLNDNDTDSAFVLTARLVEHDYTKRGGEQ